MATSRDVLHLKTDAELRFFVEHPSYYQAELVTAAQRELKRRGAALTMPPAAAPQTPDAATAPGQPRPLAPTLPDYTPDYSAAPNAFEAAPSHRPWLLPASLAAVLLLAGLGFWARPGSHRPATPPVATQPPTGAGALPPDSLKLETVAASPLPTYDTDAYVKKALALVPTADRKNAQQADQYRAISRRFWAAQNPSAHLIKQAQQGQASAVFGAQARLVLSLWHDFDRTQVYSYSFGPGMADHLARMKAIARCQREALQELANDAEAQRPVRLDNDESLAHQQAVPGLLAPLEHKISPATVHL